MIVRTRFAPSPTGELHVGSVRTALFSWLFARHHQGQFILRIEDTDRERSTKESIDAILKGMDWIGLNYDEGPFYQTDRYDRYKAIADKMIAEDQAYRCFCSKERLETLRETQLNNKEKPRYDGHCRDKNLNASDEPFVIRFKNPKEGSVSFEDQVYGLIEVQNSELDDLILIRSDNHPTYNFAVVIDDWDMNITHVIRGDDHVNNTPRQINLLQALKAPVPIYAHLPMILGEDGKRLSKRHGAVGVMQFQEQGILPKALLNYLVRLGWSNGDQEVFSLKEMIQYFDLTHVHRGISCFNYEKLYWLNQHYLKTEPEATTAEALAWQFERMNIDPKNGPSLEKIVAIQADRSKTLVEMAEKSVYFYQDAIFYDDAAVKKQLRPFSLEPLTELYHRLEKLDDWDSESIHQTIHQLSEDLNLNLGKIGQPLRVAVTGTTMSPAIDETLALIGKERSLARLQKALSLIRTRANEME